MGYSDELPSYGGQGSRTGSWEEYNARIQAYRNKYGQHYNPDMVARGEKEGQWGANMLLGGPVGWYKGISGKDITQDLFGEGVFKGTTLSGHMTEEVYDYMSPEDWKKFAHLDGAEQIAFIQGKQKEIAKFKNDPKRKAAKEAADKLAAEKAAREGQQADILAKVKAFADEMNLPVDELLKRDDFAQALRATTIGQSYTQANNRGLGTGGISNQNADLMSKRALLGYQMQRQQMGQQAYGQAYGMINNQGLQAEDLRRYNQGMDLQMQGLAASARNQQYMQGLGQAQNRASMIGGIIGGAMGGPMGYQFGSSLGGAAGGMRYQNQNTYKPYEYQYPSGSGGMTGRGYGGGNS